MEHKSWELSIKIIQTVVRRGMEVELDYFWIPSNS